MRCKSRVYPNSQPFDGPSCSVVKKFIALTRLRVDEVIE